MAWKVFDPEGWLDDVCDPGCWLESVSGWGAATSISTADTGSGPSESWSRGSALGCRLLMRVDVFPGPTCECSDGNIRSLSPPFPLDSSFPWDTSSFFLEYAMTFRCIEQAMSITIPSILIWCAGRRDGVVTRRLRHSLKRSVVDFETFLKVGHSGLA